MGLKQNITYILECNDKTLYTGWTNNIAKRLEAHGSGQGAKYTRGRTPVKLVYLEIHDTKQEAMRREAEIKKFNRRQKEALIYQNQKAVRKFLEQNESDISLTLKAYLPQKSTS